MITKRLIKIRISLGVPRLGLFSDFKSLYLICTVYNKRRNLFLNKYVHETGILVKISGNH